MAPFHQKKGFFSNLVHTNILILIIISSILHILASTSSLFIESCSRKNMETLTGFIIDLTDERRGPVKFYKRFTMITTNKENVSGWIFSSNAIEETTAGNVLSEAVKKQSEVTIKGKISTEAGMVYI